MNLYKDDNNKIGLLSRFAIYGANHKVSSIIFSLFLVIGGFILFYLSSKEVFPKIQIDQVMIFINYNNDSPENLEESIAKPIENAIVGLDGINKIRDKIETGSVRVLVEAKTLGGVQQLYNDVQNAVNGIHTFPSDMAAPAISVLKIRNVVAKMAISGQNMTENMLREVLEVLRNQFEQDRSSGIILVRGEKTYETRVDISKDTLRKYGLTLESVSSLVTDASQDILGGEVKNDIERINLRFNDKKYDAEDLKNIVVKTDKNGNNIYLKDIANIYDYFEDEDKESSFNNNLAEYFYMEQPEGQTPQETVSAILKNVQIVKLALPKEAKINILENFSDIYSQRANILMSKGIEGVILVFLILSIFLNIKFAFKIALSIPIIFLGSFWILYFIPNFSINMMSLFAFIIIIGVSINSSIVLGEAIYTYKEKGESPQRAITEALKDNVNLIFVSAIASVFSLLPLLFLPGKMGKLFFTIPLVMVMILIISFFNAVFLLPSSLNFKESKSTLFSNVSTLKNKMVNDIYSYISNTYIKFTYTLIKHRYLLAIIIVSILMVAVAFISSGRLGMTIMPNIAADEVVLDIIFPDTATLEAKTAMRKDLVKKVESLIARNGGTKLARGVAAAIDDNELEITAFLQSMNDGRTMPSSDFRDLWKKNLGDLPGIESFSLDSSMGTPGGKADIKINISHENSIVLSKATAELVEALKKYRHVTNVYSSDVLGRTEYSFKINSYGIALGFTPQVLANSVKNSISGIEANEQVKNTSSLITRVELLQNERASQFDINNLLLHSPVDNSEVYLHDVATYSVRTSPTIINREDLRKVISLEGYVDNDKITADILNKFLATDFKEVAAKYPGLSYKYSGRQEEIQKSVQALLIGLILVLIGIYSVSAIFLNDFLKPFFVMLPIPFAILGGVLGHLFFNYTMSVSSLIGFLALIGMVIYAPLIVINETKRLILLGKDSREAMVKALSNKLRVIILSSVTIILGALPTVLSNNSEIAFLKPIAVVFVFGFLFSFLSTAIILPITYNINKDIEKYFKANRL